MKRSFKRILITGGAGFIGSHVVRRFVHSYSDSEIYNLDALTYAGNLENLRDIESQSNYHFLKIDINDAVAVEEAFEKYQFDAVVHLAAESHVDRSISDPNSFIITNILGTANLLNAARKLWADDMTDKMFYHVSTDEVYGSLGETGFFLETTPYDPQSPYSASKAGSDHLVRAYHNTYKLPVVISNCSNNYGPNQFPEKLLPLMINNVVQKKPLPVYGKGDNIRDWLFVEDHARAIDLVLHQGKLGDTYNIGGFNEWKNIDIVHLLCKLMDEKLGRPVGDAEKSITFVKDRAGHDKRYAIDANKIMKELGWEPSLQFEEGLAKTIDWYLENSEWMDNITGGSYQEYYKKHYSN